LDYNLDLVKFLGIEIKDKDLFMPIESFSEEYIKRLLETNGISSRDRVVAINPSASCPSKMWSLDRFAQVADRLIGEFKVKVVLVGSQEDIGLCTQVTVMMKQPYIDLSGKTTVSQLASLIKRCCLFISNDSGPVHIASSLGTSVIAIFGRAQAGLSPVRWGPTSKNSAILHKDVGCKDCAAHNCKKDFMCLKAISVDEVMQEVKSFLED
jgi:ADP-heptose:LPS heptosyltransferase